MTTSTTTLANVPTKDLTEKQARKLTDDIKKNLDTLPKHVYRAMTGKAYKALNYASVRDWSQSEFGLGRSRMYQFLTWQTIEMALRERYGLLDDWSMPEERFRHLKGERYRNLLDTIDAELTDAGNPDEAEKKAVIVQQAINNDFNALKQERADKAKASVKDDNPAGDDAHDAKECTAGYPDPKAPPARILPAFESFEMLVQKARDTASVLESLGGAADSDTGMTLTKLNDAKAVLDSLIAYYSTVTQNDGSVESDEPAA